MRLTSSASTTPVVETARVLYTKSTNSPVVRFDVAFVMVIKLFVVDFSHERKGVSVPSRATAKSNENFFARLQPSVFLHLQRSIERTCYCSDNAEASNGHH